MALSTEQKVGIFFLLALLALGAMIEVTQDWHPFEEKIRYHAYFDSAVGIKKGDPVRLAGVEVGKIEQIGIDETRVRVDFYVFEGTAIKEDSTASLRQTNVLGGQFLGIDLGSAASENLPPGSVVETQERASIEELIANLDRNQERVLGNLGDLIQESRDSIAAAANRVESIATKIDRGEGTLGKLVNDPELYDQVRTGAEDLKRIVARIENGEGSLGKLVRDPALYEETRETMANLRALSGRVRQGRGSIGRLFAEERLYENANDALVQVREVAAKANRGTGSLGKLVNDDALYENSREAMSRINSIAAKIDEGEGTVGQLVNDDALYRDARTTLNKVEKTVDGLSDSGPLSALGVVVGTLF